MGKQHLPEAIDALEALPTNPTADQVYDALSPFDGKDGLAAAHYVYEWTPPGTGATTLTGLTDVTGDQAPGVSPVGDQGTEFPLTRVTTKEDLQAILAAVAEVVFHPIPLGDGITNANTDPNARPNLAPARYRLTLNNIVHLEGILKCEPPLISQTQGRVLATLPPECRSDYILTFDAPTDAQNPVQLDLNPDGTLVFNGYFYGTGEAQFVSLCGINYSVGNINTVITTALNTVFK